MLTYHSAASYLLGWYNFAHNFEMWHSVSTKIEPFCATFCDLLFICLLFTRLVQQDRDTARSQQEREDRDISCNNDISVKVIWILKIVDEIGMFT